jgi:hypothetical protein
VVQVGVGIGGNARKKNDHSFAQCVGGIYDDVERRLVEAPLSPLDPVPDASAAGIRRLGPAPRDSWILREFLVRSSITHGATNRCGRQQHHMPSTFIVLRAGWRERAKMKFSWRERKPVVNIFSEGKRQVSSAGFSGNARSRLPRARRRRWPSRRGSAKCGRL